ncbi:MAG: potassium transporter TrkG, partial [Chloroflexota bacterium]|nr:potassium transporter TrkG [Chloroflexota bacterium]
MFLRLRELGLGDPVWQAAFHSISAFNNAGFDLQGGFVSLIGFQQETYLLGVIAGLLILGGLGVPLLLEILTRRPWFRWSLDAKLSITSVLWLVVLGSAAIFVAELLGQASVEGLSPGGKAMNAFFLSAAARTAGFANLEIGRLTLQTLLVLMVLMFIGGVSGSTAGGVKVNTFATIVLTAISYLRGHRRVHAFRRAIPEAQVHRAIAVVFLGIAFIFITTLLLTITDYNQPFVSLLFEVVSASTTTGFTTGITWDLSTGGQVLLMLAMFVGRLGPVTAVLALARRAQVAPEPDEPEEAIRIG